MNVQEEVDRLENLFSEAAANASEITRIYNNVIAQGTGSVAASNLIPFLNQSAPRLLSPQVVNIMKKCRLDAYNYLLVANDLIELEDVKDSLLNDNVLEGIAPANGIRKLKAEFGLATMATKSGRDHPIAIVTSEVTQKAHSSPIIEEINSLTNEIKKCVLIMFPRA